MRLENKVALITGANSGIGKGIALRFAQEGAHVGVNYLPGGTRDADAQAEIAAFPTEGIALAGDVSKRDDVQKMVDTLVAKFGRIDILVNNAGIEINKPFLEGTDDEWNRVLNVNLFGTYLCTQIAVKQMVKQGPGGRIINISSTHEDIPFQGYTSYCASKGAIRMMMRNLCLEFAPYQITCNNIAPGAIATPINQKVLDDPEANKNALSEIPLGRWGTPEDVAGVALFLASDEAAYVTGSTYYIDGGLVQQVTKY